MLIELGYKKDIFTCLFCGGNTQHNWEVFGVNEGKFVPLNIFSNCQEKIAICECVVCKKYSIWKNENLVNPLWSNLAKANEDMPENTMQLYNEAKDVYPLSKKSSAALLRLALQYLCIELGEKGKNINDDIANLVSKGLSVEVQQVLDILRVTGNNAVHPGQLNLDEKPELVSVMFEYINIIVDKFYTEPRKIAESYEKLPEGVRLAIARRK